MPDEHNPEVASTETVKPSVEELLGGIVTTAAAIEEAKQDFYNAVALARAEKVSWAAIGGVLDISRQAAWERLADKVKESTEAE